MEDTALKRGGGWGGHHGLAGPSPSRVQAEGSRASWPEGRGTCTFLEPSGRGGSIHLLLVHRGPLWVNVVPHPCGLASGHSLHVNWTKAACGQVNTVCLGKGERAGVRPPLAPLAGYPCSERPAQLHMVVVDPTHCARAGGAARPLC